jgi:hypothetical protein
MKLSKKNLLKLLALILGNALLLPGCTTTTSQQPAAETANYASIEGSDTRKGLGLVQNATFQSYYWVAITTVDGQKPPTQLSGPTLISPDHHTIGVQCMTNSNPDLTEYATVTLVAKPKTKYQIVLNLPNSTDFYVHPCDYAVVKSM